MNDTSATSQPVASLLPSGTGTITTIHLVVILLVAIAAIAIIVAGIRRKRIRTEADRQLDRHAEEAGLETPSAAAPGRAAVPLAPPPPVPAPAPASVAPPPSPVVAEPVEAAALADEPIVAVAPLAASPATEAIDPAPSAAGTAADGPVTQLKGLGPKVASRLAELGITRIGQVAALDDAAATALDAQLGAFSGRMARDRWVEQARFLSAGDRAGFEAVFGRL